MWAEADASLCDKCMAPNVVINQPVLGHVYKGLDKVKDLVENHYKKVCSLRASSSIAILLFASFSRCPRPKTWAPKRLSQEPGCISVLADDGQLT